MLTDRKACCCCAWPVTVLPAGCPSSSHPRCVVAVVQHPLVLQRILLRSAPEGCDSGPLRRSAHMQRRQPPERGADDPCVRQLTVSCARQLQQRLSHSAYVTRHVRMPHVQRAVEEEDAIVARRRVLALRIAGRRSPARQQHSCEEQRRSGRLAATSSPPPHLARCWCSPDFVPAQTAARCE